MSQSSATTSVLWQELGQTNVLLIEWMAFWEMMAILFNWAAWAMKKKKKKRKDVMKDFYPVKCKEHQERMSWWGNVFLVWEKNDQQSIAKKGEASKYIPVKEEKSK